MAIQPRAAGSNFVFAGINVLVWKTFTTVSMLIPTAAFIESFKHTPTLRSDGTWVWSYSVAGHTASLERSVVENEIQWDMYISKAGDFERFLWYTGKHNLSITQGTWTLKKAPDANYDYVGIDWHINTDGTSDIKYTNIIPADSGDNQASENGGYIFYGTTTASDYDAFFNIYNKGQNNLTNIEWNRSSKVGRVKDFNKFADDEWHCWDETLANANCP